MVSWCLHRLQYGACTNDQQDATKFVFFKKQTIFRVDQNISVGKYNKREHASRKSYDYDVTLFNRNYVA